jgi:hypothetical protein
MNDPAAEVEVFSFVDSLNALGAVAFPLIPFI